MVNDWYFVKGSRSGHRILYTQAYVAKVPLLLIDWDDETQVSLHNRIVSEVQGILEKEVGRSVNANMEPLFREIMASKGKDPEREEYLRIGKGLCAELESINPIKKSGILKIPKGIDGRFRSKDMEDAYLASIGDGTEFEFEGKTATFTYESKSRTWTDFEITYEEETFHYNFKAGEGNSDDDIGGLAYIRYLICNEIGQPASEVRFCEEILGQRDDIDVTPRDYFLFAVDANSGHLNIIAVGEIQDEDLVTNPRNQFQTNPHTADAVTRTQEEATLFLIRKFIEYTRKKAASYAVFTDAGLTEKTGRSKLKQYFVREKGQTWLGDYTEERDDWTEE